MACENTRTNYVRHFLMSQQTPLWLGHNKESCPLLYHRGNYRVSVETIEKRSTSRKLAPNYRVLLHNDDHNSMEHVVQVLVTNIPNMSETSAISVMMEAHQNEMALVIVCNQEHAEHYCDVLKSHGLRSTIEPAE